VNFVSRASLASSPPLRDAMRHLVSGVCIITAGLGDDRTGMTVTSATSLSVEPPTMVVCVNGGSSVWQRILRYRHFCVSILAGHQQEIAERFAGRGGLAGVARFAGANWLELATGAPALAGALASRLRVRNSRGMAYPRPRPWLGKRAANRGRRCTCLQPSPIRDVFHCAR
jgi:flavin reductase (DIM6/NTAB) family NADH-FMN oxidoreductase RutF